MSLNNIQRKLGLHEEVTILYVVDGYQAIFSRNDGRGPDVTAEGQTVEAALAELDWALATDETE